MRGCGTRFVGSPASPHAVRGRHGGHLPRGLGGVDGCRRELRVGLYVIGQARSLCVIGEGWCRVFAFGLGVADERVERHSPPLHSTAVSFFECFPLQRQQELETDVW